MSLLDSYDYDAAIELLSQLGEYEDSQIKLIEAYFAKFSAYNINTVAVNDEITFAVGEDDGIICTIEDEVDFDYHSWKDLQSIYVSNNNVVAITNDNEVLCLSENEQAQQWSDITSIAFYGDTIIGLQSDGTVVSSEEIEELSQWSDIVAICANDSHIIGIKSDATLEFICTDCEEDCGFENLSDIMAVSCSEDYFAFLQTDGTVIVVGETENGQAEVDSWADIVAISAGEYHVVGLKADGTVVSTQINVENEDVTDDNTEENIEENIEENADENAEENTEEDQDGNQSEQELDFGQTQVEEWENIIAIFASETHTVGLKADGTLVAVGNNEYAQCEVSTWSNIKTN